MKTVSKGVLKVRMSAIFRELEKNGGELIVTDHGKPVLKITRYAKGPSIDVIFAELRKKAKIPSNAAIESTKGKWLER